MEKILDHENITVQLNTVFTLDRKDQYDHLFYSGPIAAYFDFKLGRLAYRTLDFKEIRADSDFQGCAVMNYGDAAIPHTRISEHKYFSPWDEHDKTICFEEYSRTCEPEDIPYYPIRLVEEKSLLRKYVDLAQGENNVTFLGRLGTYRYLDMDVTVGEALAVADEFLRLAQNKQSVPTFFVKPV